MLSAQFVALYKPCKPPVNLNLQPHLQRVNELTQEDYEGNLMAREVYLLMAWHRYVLVHL